MRLIVTRPQPQADEWVAALHARGVQAEALPLIDIGPAADEAPVHQAWVQLSTMALAMFVSPNAVGRFFACRPAAATWPAQLWAGSTGPGTSAALLAAGVPPECVVQPDASAAQFDSEALWARLAALRSWQGARVLIVRGEGGRDWLAQTLAGQGAQVSCVQAYRRAAPQLDAAQQAVLARALADPAGHLWLFSSSEAIGHLLALAPAGTTWQQARALASHPRIAARARAAGFGRVRQVRPTMEAVLQALG
ncbi:uroporphyrinogen-III synthase [Ideonella sp. BN130291]|uniref:uroporphyrinogen-III synthase n=1 Tax=Ideonella sp. BN130291 TaxID=3112940 RepID=UPI002E26EDDF|nr:uroporphyrinogen-III synthase [Ideonella sp. BN130291]